jgi:hypothetical protein
MTNILTRNPRGGLLAGPERPVRPGLVLAVVLTGQFMALLDSSIVNVAAPSIHANLGASGTGRSGPASRPPRGLRVRMLVMHPAWPRSYPGT